MPGQTHALYVWETARIAHNNVAGLQELGGWGQSGAASSVNGSYENSTISTACVPNAGGSPGDAYYDNPTYTIYNYTANSFSTSLTLTILLDAFPINLYPYAWVLPTGSTLIMTGAARPAASLKDLEIATSAGLCHNL